MEHNERRKTMMTKADKFLVRDIHNILDNGYKDINPRPVYEDGTPAHTISVNHVMRQYDMAKGEFPLCTLRSQAWKTGIRESSLSTSTRPTCSPKCVSRA